MADCAVVDGEGEGKGWVLAEGRVVGLLDMFLVADAVCCGMNGNGMN